MTITSDAATIFRDFETPGSALPHEPNKPAIRGLFSDIDASIVAAAVGARAYLTWAALAADTSQEPHTLAMVGTADTGTHTDPVLGGTVPNSGYFTWSASPAGWARLFDVIPAAQYVPCTVTVVGSYWLWTPKTGFSISSVGVNQVLFGVAPADSGGSLDAVVVGINDSPPDQRNVRLADGVTTVTTDQILEGGFCSIYYHSTGPRAGLFQLVDGLVGSGGSGGGGGLLTKMSQTSRINNLVEMAPADGYELPNNTGDDTIMVWEVEADGVLEASWNFSVAGINAPDPYPVKYRDGTALPPTTPKAGDRIFFGRPGGTGGFFTIFQHWRPDTAQDSGSSGLSPYEQATAAGAAQRAANAERLARRVLAKPFGFEAGVGGAVTQASSKSTGVTLNKLCGRITMNGASLGAGAAVAFTLTNSEIEADDVVVVTIKSGATALAYHVQVEATAAGSCVISLHRAQGGGSLSEAIVLNFVVIKSVAA